MPLLERFLRGFAPPKSSLQVLHKSPLEKEINGYWRLFTGKAQDRRRKLSALFALAVIASAASALAQRPIGIDISDFQSSGLNWSTLKNTYGISFAWAKASEG